jgi:hypothetical protein
MSDNPKKIFPMQLTNGKIFNISVSQINKILGWVWNTKLKINISAYLIVLLKMIATIRIKLKITSRLSSLYRFVETIKVSRIRTAYTFKMLMRVIQTFKISYPRLILIFKMILRMNQTIKISRVRIAYNAVLAQFILLGTHDYSDYPVNTSPRTLGNRDSVPPDGKLERMDGTYI